MASKSSLDKLTGAEQTRIMQGLTQQAAGWLLGLTARTLRDHPDLPRGADGRYNARDLVAWASERMERPELGPDDTEQMTVVVEAIYGAASEDEEKFDAIVDYLRQLRNEHGEPGLTAFAAEMLRVWGGMADVNRKQKKRTPEQIEAAAERQRRLLAEQQARAEAEAKLQIAVVCERCGLLRRGRQWIKARPPAGYAVNKDLCPDCRRK